MAKSYKMYMLMVAHSLLGLPAVPCLYRFKYDPWIIKQKQPDGSAGIRACVGLRDFICAATQNFSTT